MKIQGHSVPSTDLGPDLALWRRATVDYRDHSQLEKLGNISEIGGKRLIGVISYGFHKRFLGFHSSHG